MTFSTKITDANFTKYVTALPPHLELAQMFLLLGTDAASSRKNYAGAKQDATVVGTPTYGTGFATLSALANGFEAPMAGSKSPFTHIAVVKPFAFANSGYCGNWVQTAGVANLLNKASSTLLKLAVDGNQRVEVAMAGAGFQFIAGSHDLTTAKVYCAANGVLNSGSLAFSGNTATAAKFRIGANGYGSEGNFDAAAVMTFNTALTDQQVADIYGYLKTLLSLRGISVS